jgi:flagellar biogenesis protein FliO
MSAIATYIVETLVTLLGVVALAILILVGGKRLGIGRVSGPLELVGKLPLDPRRAVYLVRVGKLVYVLAASEGGVVRLGELDADTLPREPAKPLGLGFREVLSRMQKQPGPGPVSEGKIGDG